MCAAVLCLEAIVLGLTTPVMITLTDVSTSTALVIGLGLAVACLLLAGLLRARVGVRRSAGRSRWPRSAWGSWCR